MKCLKWINFRIFCCVFSLQSGVIITIVVFTTIFVGMLIMSIYTVSILGAWTIENFSGLFLSYSHAAFVIIAIYIAFCGAYKEQPKLMRIAAFLMLIALLIFLVASIMSYIPGIFPYACVTHRCPDHVWMEDSHWRAYYFAKKEYVFLRSDYNHVWNCRWGIRVNPSETRRQNSVEKRSIPQGDIDEMRNGSDPHLSLKLPSWDQINNIIRSILQSKQEPDIDCLSQSMIFNRTNELFVEKTQEDSEVLPDFSTSNQINNELSILNSDNRIHVRSTERQSERVNNIPEQIKSHHLKQEDNFVTEHGQALDETRNPHYDNDDQPDNIDMASGLPNEEKEVFSLVRVKRADETVTTESTIQLTDGTAIYRIRFPTFGLLISILFNILYLAFLVYTVLTYIAFANELESVDFEGDYLRWLRAKGYA